MSKITVTIDTDLHKVVPVIATMEIVDPCMSPDQRMYTAQFYEKLVASVPYTLPGVVERIEVIDDREVAKLITVARRARNVELAERLEWAGQDLIKQAEKIDKLEAQIAAQAGQEPIGKLMRRNGVVSFHTDKMLSELSELPDETLLYAAPPANGINASDDKIREIFMRNGFTIKEGESDLKEYVFNAAYELIDAARGK
jgi:hypothetical protein